MKNKWINNQGFTLIELILVVAIIGILAAIAIPNFLSYQCKVKQSEAKAVLGHIRIRQEAYFVEKGTYADNIIHLGFIVPKGDPKYDYTIDPSSVSVSSFIAIAQAKPGKGLTNSAGGLDKWTINVNATVSNEVPGCGN
ncbi:type IV pilin protein [Desulfotignum balticum]|uniref:type IV pilin protein n=1 Tax=Desulfotignum balticum TaxID=115781 RepID=UPI000418FD7F|nr:type IV pilin-like G/H family protein [Desulfotignum balticum]